MRIWQQALGHGHGQVGNACLFDQRADIRVRLGVGGPLAQHDQRLLRAPEQLDSTLDGVGAGNLLRRRIDDLD